MPETWDMHEKVNEYFFAALYNVQCEILIFFYNKKNNFFYSYFLNEMTCSLKRGKESCISDFNAISIKP